MTGRLQKFIEILPISNTTEMLLIGFVVHCEHAPNVLANSSHSTQRILAAVSVLVD